MATGERFLKFRCTGCGNCCKDPLLPLTDQDITRITQRIGVEAETFVRWVDRMGIDMDDEPEAFVMLRQGKRVMTLRHEGGKCRYLGDDDRCSIYGSRPLGWYLGRCSPNTRRLVAEDGGFLYDADSYADELPYWDTRHGRPQLIVPYTLDVNDMRFATNQGFNSGDQFFAYLKDSFDMLYGEGETAPKMLSVGLHCRLVGRPGRAAALARFLDYVQGHPRVWLARRVDIARQLVESPFGAGPDVLMGGGRREFLPKDAHDPEYPDQMGSRGDGRDLVAEWKSRHPGGTYAWNAAQLLSRVG